MKTREIIEHLEKYEELIDHIDFLSIRIEDLSRPKIEIHCSRYEKATRYLFKNNANKVAVSKLGDKVDMSLDVEGVNYFMLVNNEDEANEILKGE